MTNRSVQFYHVDDERDRVDWIPDCLRTLFYNIHPQRWDEAGPLEEKVGDGRQDYRFNLLFTNGDEVWVTYTLVDHESALEEVTDLAGAIVILDLMRMEGTKLELVADRVYLALRDRKVPTEKIFILTAYEEKLAQDALPGLPADNILIKPIDPEALAETLLKAAKVSS